VKMTYVVLFSLFSFTRTPLSTLFPYTTLFRSFSMNHNDVPSLIKTVGANGLGQANKELSLVHLNLIWSPVAFVDLGIEGAWGHRSEEHTSELQSRSDIVCRLLLEKKKQELDEK